MPDIIRLLPDSVANQIAAGEVIQRPASAVKELLENAVDAGATVIKLIVKDAGKTLLQVTDNGKGMSETDARLCFERHATSKIEKADDLFNIRTKGFRGEALASIAAIAQVELKTRLHGEQLGTQINIEGSDVKSQEPCACPEGTSFSIKNLFYNVPARRNFLKSDPVEFRHIIEEFQRVALPHPEISFSLHHNGQEVLHLPAATFRQRIASIFGNNYNERLVPVEEETSIVKVTGFIGKPQFARKTRGEQFFFLNHRFIKSAYLHHAVQMAFEELLPADSFPSYFLLLDVQPHTIDINIHPTKTEVKFEDEKFIYSILRSAVKRSLGKYNISPTLDFEREQAFDLLPSKNTNIKAPTITVNPDYNPFDVKEKVPSSKEISYGNFAEKKLTLHPDNQQELPEQHSQQHFNKELEQDKEERKQNYQLHHKYILSHIKTGFMIIDQQAAHERVLYERFLKQLNGNKSFSQQLLFPMHIEFSIADFELVKELREDICALGFDISEFGKNTFIVHGIPSQLTEVNAKQTLEQIIEHYKHNKIELKLDKRENLARSMARNMSIKAGKVLSNEEMNNLVDELFACEMPYASPNGKPTLTTFTLEDLERRFKK
ncbi:MAG TPA: DNA mismatch repair endonuclease MutL [Bacteroidia bacterium]